LFSVFTIQSRGPGAGAASSASICCAWLLAEACTVPLIMESAIKAQASSGRTRLIFMMEPAGRAAVIG
jgi:hypothetical protein